MLECRAVTYQESPQPSPSASAKLYAAQVFVESTTATRCEPRRRGLTMNGTQEVEAAGPVTGANDAQHCRAVPMRAPVDANGPGLGDAARLHVLFARPSGRLVREHLQPELPCVRGEPDLGSLSRGVAAPGERRVDTLHAHDRSVLPAVRAVGPVDPVSHGEPRDVRARLRRRRGTPCQRVPAPVEALRRSPHDGRPALARPHHVRHDDLQPHRCRPRQPEADDGRVTEAVVVRADSCEQTCVAGERCGAVADVQVEERRGGCRERSGGDEHGRDHAGVTSLTVSLPSNDAGHNCRINTSPR